MEYKTNTNELTSVANAIRTKGGTSAQLEYPNGFISAIQNIPSGGSVNLQTKSKTYTPTTSQQTETVSPDSGYNGLSQVNVTVNPIPSQYIVPSGSDTKTANGTYDVTNLAEIIVDVAGATNFVTGTISTGSTTGVKYTITPYTGDGYPIMAVIVVEGGAYVSGTDWYNSVQRYAIGQWTMTKSNMSAPPTYGTSGVANQGVTTWIYKNSTSSSTTYSRSSAMTTNTFSSSDPQGAGATCVRFKDSTHLYYYVNTSSYGLHPNTTYRYFIVYSE